MKKDNRYFIFDSHSRNRQGLMNANGSSILLEVPNIFSVYEQCQRLKRSMNCSDKTQYEVTGLNVNILAIDVPGTENIEQNDIINDNNCTENVNDNDIFISHVEETRFTFNPLSLDKRNRICTEIGIDNDAIDIRIQPVCQLKKPSHIKSIEPDGNCFFRALTYSLNNSEKSHRKIRLAIVTNLTENEILFNNLVLPEYDHINDYIRQSRMKYLGTWSTEIEILSAAQLFQTDIYIYTNNKWIKYSPLLVDNERYSTDSFYLIHQNQNHYDVVIDIERTEEFYYERNIQGNESKNTSEQESQSEISIKKRKRGHKWTKRKRIVTLSTYSSYEQTGNTLSQSKQSIINYLINI